MNKCSVLKFIILLLLFSQGCKFDFTICPWKDGIIPYYLKGDFSDTDIQNITAAMSAWESVCGVRFKKVTPRSGAYVIKRVSQQVWQSSVGENNTKCQMLFGRYYSDIDVIIHELGHCLGLEHEHQRPDRDLYVTIVWSNILSGKEYNFEIIDNPLVVEEDYAYDYTSIMHYDPVSFSINGHATILSNDGTVISPSDTITELDAAKAKEIYGPPKTSTDE